MARSVEIFHTGVFPKDLTVKDIIGDDLSVGSYDMNWRIMVGKITPDMGVFDPKKPGRAINLLMDPENKKTTKLNLPIPCSDNDVEIFVKLVVRIAKKVRGSISIDGGDEIPYQVFEANEGKMKEFNDNAIKEVADKLLKGESPSFCVFGAYWPLFMGREEAEKIAENVREFDNWLCEKQLMDVYYAGVNFYKGPQGPFGVYALSDECESVFPNKPRIPFGFGVNGKPLECKDFRVFLGSKDEKIGEISYDDFLKKIPKDKITRYDEADFLLADLTLDELRALV